MEIRQNLIIYIFFTFCVFVIAWSSVVGFRDYGVVEFKKKSNLTKSEIEESFFKDVEYYFTLKQKPLLNFGATHLLISTIDQKVVAAKPAGKVYRDFENGSLDFSAKVAKFLLDKKEIYLNEDVKVATKDALMEAQKISFLQDKDWIKADGAVKTIVNRPLENEKILINSDQSLFFSKQKKGEFKGRVMGRIERNFAYEESLSFFSNVITFEFQSGLANLVGEVKIKKDNLQLEAGSGQLFIENYNKKLKYYALNDDVRLEESISKGSRPMVRKAMSEKLEGFLSEKKIVLTGLPKVFQDKDVIKGNKITLRENNETVEVEDANTNITIQK